MLAKIKSLLMNKRVIAVGAIAILMIGFMYRQNLSKSNSPTYQTATVEKGTIISSVSTSGQMLSAGNTLITTQASGTIKNVFVKNGDTVVSGQKIIEISLDQQGLQKQSQAWASYLSAKNSLASANATQYSLQSAEFVANQKFMNDAVARNLVTTDPTYIEQSAQWLAAEAQFKNQSAVIDQAQVAVNNSWLSYSVLSPVVTSPISGTISDLNVVPGMSINAQGSGSSTTSTINSSKIASILTNSLPIAQFNLSEADILKVQAGQKVTITLDALPNKTFTGKVVGIDKTGSITSGVTNYPVTIQFDTNPGNILPNMSASASIIINSKNDVLLVPSSAIQTDNGQSYARISKNNQVQEVQVTTGLTSDTQTEIDSGLNEGDTVITGTISSTSSQGQTSIFGGGNRTGGAGGAVFRTGGVGGGR